jgi:hypothetical protein
VQHATSPCSNHRRSDMTCRLTVDADLDRRLHRWMRD